MAAGGRLRVAAATPLRVVRVAPGPALLVRLGDDDDDDDGDGAPLVVVVELRAAAAAAAAGHASAQMLVFKLEQLVARRTETLWLPPGLYLCLRRRRNIHGCNGEDVEEARVLDGVADVYTDPHLQVAPSYIINK